MFSNAENLISLYNAIYNTQIPLNAPVDLVTLENVLFEDVYNDIAFILGGKLIVLVEHQSTVNENMPLRFLLYIAREYEKLIDPRSKYREALLKIPRPDFIVLYNGTNDFPEEKVLRLSDAFENIPMGYALESLGSMLELTVRVLNINEGRNQAIAQKCEVLRGYARVIALARHYYKQGMTLAEAIAHATKECIRDGVLAEFLTIHASEVVNMLTGEFDLQIAKRVWQEESLAKGLQQGLQQGRAEERAQWQDVVSANEATLAGQAALIAQLQAQLAAQIQGKT